VSVRLVRALKNKLTHYFILTRTPVFSASEPDVTEIIKSPSLPGMPLRTLGRELGLFRRERLRKTGDGLLVPNKTPWFL